MTAEQALIFESGGHRLLGVLHEAGGDGALGVLVIVGGPQYRVGSHRQFVHLARNLARHGVPVLRFDYSGMGDSEGAAATFEHVQEDVAAAVDALLAGAPQVRRVVLWGLCDGASAALMYAPSDRRVAGIVLLNPWVRTEAGLARTQLWTYYPRRLLSAQFWRKVTRQPQALLRSAKGFLGTVRRSRAAGAAPGSQPAAGSGAAVAPSRHFLDRMIEGAERYGGRMIVLLSGADLTAGEFKATVAAQRRWRRAFGRPQVATCELADANHTFSSRIWRNWAEEKTLEFVRAL